MSDYVEIRTDGRRDGIVLWRGTRAASLLVTKAELDASEARIRRRRAWLAGMVGGIPRENFWPGAGA